MIGHDSSPLYKCHSCYNFGWHDFLSLFSVVGVLSNQKTEFTYIDGTVSSLQLEVIRTQCSEYDWRKKVLIANIDIYKSETVLVSEFPDLQYVEEHKKTEA